MNRALSAFMAFVILAGSVLVFVCFSCLGQKSNSCCSKGRTNTCLEQCLKKKIEASNQDNQIRNDQPALDQGYIPVSARLPHKPSRLAGSISFNQPISPQILPIGFNSLLNHAPPAHI